MRKLVPIQVIIRRKRDNSGQPVNDYPDFNKIPEGIRGSLDWCHAIDHYGIGMHYSRDGFGQGEDPHSQICGTCVPDLFATTAVEMFPDRVKILSEADWEKFYDDDAHSHEPEENLDASTLQAIAAKKLLGIELTQSDRNALDPNHPAIGIQKNMRRFWKDAKKYHGITIADHVATSLVKSDPGPEELPSCC